MSDAEKQVALVTGAGRGIGRAVAVALARTGRHVIVNYRSNDEAAAETLRLIEVDGGTAELSAFDVTDEAAVTEAVGALLARHGHIDVLVNNAGIRNDMLMVWMTLPDWRSVVDTSLTGFFLVTRLIVKEMVVRRSGRIVNISSTAGQSGVAGQVNYSAAKAGLIGATQALAREVAKRNVTVNAVAPGWIETDMTEDIPKDAIVKEIPMKRLGRPEDVAAAVLFLCSAEAAYITGQVIGVNGGGF